MGSESDDYYTPGDRPGRKPSLQARLQSGKILNNAKDDKNSRKAIEESTKILNISFGFKFIM